MSNIRFIVQGSDAANTALILKRHLQAEWNVQIDAKAADASVLPSSDAQTKNFGFDPDSLTIYPLTSIGSFSQASIWRKYLARL